MAWSGRPHPLEKNECGYHNAPWKQLDPFLVWMDAYPGGCGYQHASLWYRQTMTERPLYISGNNILVIFKTFGHLTRMLDTA